MYKFIKIKFGNSIFNKKINQQTKHYFAGSQRVSSKIGTTTNLGAFLQDWTLQENSSGGAAINLVGTSHAQLTKAEAGVNHVYTQFNMPTQTFASNTAFLPVPAFLTPPSGAWGLGTETEQYYFHPDHLGSSNYITNIAGEVSQHTEYFAFGETFVEEHKGSNNSPYKFNGKELDNESGLYYYGARYYDPRISIWASVDPLAEKFAGRSPYEYCFSNPLNLTDPTGMGPQFKKDENGNLHVEKGDTAEKLKKEYGLVVKDKNFKFKEGNVIVLNNKKKSQPQTGGCPVIPPYAPMYVIRGGAAAEGASAAAGITASSVLVGVAVAFSVKGDTPEEVSQDYLYRNMKPDGSFFSDPMLGQSANTLGIRPSDVNNRSFNQFISPLDNQGLSVTLGIGSRRFDSVTAQSIPNYSNQTNLWRLDPMKLVPFGLLVAPQMTPPGYCRIIPAYNMSIQTFHERIQATQSLWNIAPSDQR